MAELDVEQANVYYSTTGTSYQPLPEATGWAFTSDVEGETIIKTFGGGRKIRTGDDTDAYEISALFDPVGQAAFRDAKRNKTDMYIALIWDDGEGTAAAGTTQRCKITSYGYEAAADGDLQRASFSATGEGALTEITTLP